MPPKTRYSTDEFNRLVLNKDNKRYPVEGEFKIQKNLLLFLPSRKSIFTKNLDLAKQIKFEGNWQLTEEHDLKFTLIETTSQVKDDELYIRANLVSVEQDAIIFAAQFKKSQTEDTISTLTLGGRWQVDEFNKLQFFVKKDYGEDILKLTGSWQLNDNQQIVYTYQKQDLIRKTKKEEFLTLKGFWQINIKNRLAYILDLKNKSFFEFKAQLESPILRGAKGQIRYRIGVGIRNLIKEDVILLFGTWKINRQKSISFEMDYGKGNIKQIVFGASVYLDKDNEIVFELKNKKGESIGIAVGFKRQFFRNDGILFARISKLEKDSRLEAGVRINW